MPDLSHSVSTYRTIRNQIVALEADLDEETLADTLEGLTDLHEVIAAVVRAAVVDEALAEGLKGHVQLLKERGQRLSGRAAARRRIARDAMLEVELKKVTAPDFTVSLRPAPPRAIIIDETAVPYDFLKPQPPKLDKQSILDALKHGVAVPGATLSNRESILSVRVK